MIAIPKVPNEQTRLTAARSTAKLLVEEAGLEGDVETIAVDVARYCRTGDGFQMAKCLERAGWECDMGIAEVLDGHGFRLQQEHEAYLSRLMGEIDIQPPFPVGSAVVTRSSGSGVIDRIYEHRPMTYAIKIDGDPAGCSPTNRRVLVYWDEVEAA